MDLAQNNLQWLICHKTQPNQTYGLLHMKSTVSSKNLDSEFKPVKLRLKKLTLCHILPERRGWVNRINPKLEEEEKDSRLS